MISNLVKAPRRALREALVPTAKYTLTQVRRFVNIYNRADEFCIGNGLEVGALSLPYRFANASVTYADVMDEKDMRGVLAEIPIENLYDGELVKPDILIKAPKFELPSNLRKKFDFVYSSHSLEHSPNPIFTLSEYFRVVQNGGYIYTIIPNKDFTYDSKRMTTPFEFLRSKFEDGIFQFTPDEARDVVFNTIGHPLYAGKGEDFAMSILANNSGIHHFYTFDVLNTSQIIDYCNLKFGCQLVYYCLEGINIHFCLRIAP